MWFPFFIIGGFWFWTLLVCMFGVVVICVEVEAPFKAMWTVILTTCLLVLFGNFSPFAWIAAHPLETAAVVAGYFLSGAVWSLVKWWLFVGRRKEKYEDLKHSWLIEQGEKVTGTVPEHLREKWAGHIKRLYGYRLTYSLPQVREFKSTIMTWMVYWPWSMFWSAFDDLVRKIFTVIYVELASTFQGISNRMYANVADDFAGTELEEDYK